MNQERKNSIRFLPAKKILPQDDAFHESKFLLDIEWWYFDAVFENGLSVHIGFRIYHIRGKGILQTRINLYENGSLIKEKINRFLLSNIIIDTKEPSIIINDNTVLSFVINQNEKEWSYIISLEIEDISVNLKFTGQTEGWKIETKTTCWTVPLPNAIVSGTISLNEKTITVNGNGYHDHNWGYSPTTVLQNIGWYWGRISSENLHITWANTIASKTKQDLITVINRPYTKSNNQPLFTSIHPKNIKFNTKNYKKHDKHQIPHSFELSFSQALKNNNKQKVSSKIKMDVIDIHYDKIFIINYWRYHVKATGTIHYIDKTEELNNKTQIIEYLQF